MIWFIICRMFELPWRSIRRQLWPVIGFVAEYDNGLTFSGIEGRAWRVEWDSEGQTTGCPLVVHLPGGPVIDRSTFESPEAMRAIAGTTSSEDSGHVCVELNTHDYYVETIHKDGKLLLASAQVWKRSRESLKVEVNGRTLVLQVSEKDLIEALRPPRQIDRPVQY